MKVRELAFQLQDLARRGFGDDTVQIEVGGDGAIHKGVVKQIEASASSGVVLTSEG